MENNKDLMGWNAPGQNDPQDDGRRDQPSDPWGRTTRKQESDPIGALLKLLKDFLLYPKALLANHNAAFSRDSRYDFCML